MGFADGASVADVVSSTITIASTCHPAPNHSQTASATIFMVRTKIARAAVHCWEPCSKLSTVAMDVDSSS